MIVATNHIYIPNTCTRSLPCLSIWSIKSGVIGASFGISVPTNLTECSASPDDYPFLTKIAVDPQEQLLYMYLSCADTTVSDTIAIYSLNFANSTAAFVQAYSTGAQLSLGAQ